MEGGPYDRPPQGQPGQPAQDPAYRPPAGYEPPPERRFGLTEVAALLALLVAAVAIFFAIDANNSSTSDEEIAREVRQETQRQVNEIRSEAGGQAESADETARQASRKAEVTAEKNQESVSQLESQFSELQGEVGTLQAQQNQIRDSLEKQSEAIADIRRTLREQG
jgi:TolA-binding protein